MKKIIAVFLLFVLAAGLLTGCGESAAESIFYEGTEYKTGFYGDYEFKNDLTGLVESEFTLDGVTYQVLNLEEHDFVITKEESPTVYCAAGEWEADKAYYADAQNIFYTVAFGNALTPLDKIHVTGMEDDMYRELRRFNRQHTFNPKHPKARKDQVLCPRPEAEESEIHFYKESADELFSEGKNDIYYSVNSQVIRYYADAPDYSTDEQTVCYVVVMPEELTNFITELVNILTAMG